MGKCLIELRKHLTVHIGLVSTKGLKITCDFFLFCSDLSASDRGLINLSKSMLKLLLGTCLELCDLILYNTLQSSLQ